MIYATKKFAEKALNKLPARQRRMRKVQAYKVNGKTEGWALVLTDEARRFLAAY